MPGLLQSPGSHARPACFCAALLCKTGSRPDTVTRCKDDATQCHMHGALLTRLTEHAAAYRQTLADARRLPGSGTCTVSGAQGLLALADAQRHALHD
jgi:hypothetical protein